MHWDGKPMTFEKGKDSGVWNKMRRGSHSPSSIVPGLSSHSQSTCLAETFFLGRSCRKGPGKVTCQPNRYSGYSSCMKTEPPRLRELVNTTGFALPLCCGRDSVRIHVYVYLCAVVAHCALTRLSL